MDPSLIALETLDRTSPELWPEPSKLEMNLFFLDVWYEKVIRACLTFSQSQEYQCTLIYTLRSRISHNNLGIVP